MVITTDILSLSFLIIVPYLLNAMFLRTLKFISILTFFFFIIAISIIHLNLFSLKDKIYNKYPNLNIRKYLFSDEPVFNKINNDYNVKFLPYTELLKLKLIKKKISFKKEYYLNNQEDNKISYKKYGTFFVDIHENNLILTDYLGNNYISELNTLNNEKKFLVTKNLENNLDKDNVERIYDVLINENTIYVAYVKVTNQCRKSVISKSLINKSMLNFNEIFVSDSCHENASPGRMQIYNLNGEEGILFSISSGSYNKPSLESQDKNSIYGKTLFFNLNNNKYSVFSLGHRVVQGLSVQKDFIIATEHGPRGGDEINILKQNHNYGWPISSYGEKYDFAYSLNPHYKKSHSRFGFEEPIYSFIPAIGISEIIKLPNSFSKMHENLMIVTSLYGKSIFFIKLNNTNSGVIYSEKIFLNERIRDLKYEKKNEMILLAFEENGELGILTK